MTDIAFQTRMKPRKLKDHKTRSLRLPFGRGRLGFTSDPGEADLFDPSVYHTRLRAIVREPDGKIVEERELGSGLVTNLGALALAYDSQLLKAGAAKIGFSLLANLIYHQWGTSATPAATTDIKLGTAATNKNTKSADKAVKGTNTVTASGVGTPKFVSTATIEAESTLSITEWGIFTQELLKAEAGTGKFKEGQLTATTAEASSAILTASSEEALGERLKIIVSEENSAKEAKNGWGLVTSNSTTVFTIPAWYTEAAGGAYTPEKTAAYKVRPVMFDHRVFSVISVESGNKIEFPWELEIKSGG